MNVILKLLGNRVLRAIVAAVLDWLLSEAAAFTARYLTRSVEIVEKVAKENIPNPEKFRLAGDMLRAELKTQGIAFKDHAVDSAIQAAVGVLKAQQTAANKG